MKEIRTVHGKILPTFDLMDFLVKREMIRLEKDKKSRLKYKRKHGLTEQERLSPTDSMCNQDYVEKVEILSEDPSVNDLGKPCAIIHQLVTYIDGSTKEFHIQTTLSGITIPDREKNHSKIKKNVL